LSLDEGAVDPWTKPQYERFALRFKKSSRGKVRWNVPYGDLRPEEQALVVKAVHDFSPKWRPRSTKSTCACFLSRYRGYAHCPDCQGSRLRADAL
jgi:excinuclease ABC subunit A